MKHWTDDLLSEASWNLPRPGGAHEVYGDLLKTDTPASLAIKVAAAVQNTILEATNRSDRYYVSEALNELRQRKEFGRIANFVYGVLAMAVRNRTDSEGAGRHVR